MSNTSRILVAIAAIAMIATYFLPTWSIYLIAPQYPEGLSMQIWLNKITGQVEIINGLNHYIGMKTINADMFPEFKILPFIIGFFILYGLIVAFTGSRKMLFSFLILLVLFGIAALVDFYMWGYDYGHDLDPTAAIQVPGLTYQPPVIGHKKLLNFDAFSYPDLGAWFVIGAAVLAFSVWFIEWRKYKKSKQHMASSKNVSVVTAIFACIFFAGCTPEPEPIAYGKDNCEECKMTIMDPKFGGEIVSKKGKVYKFDDARCIGKFMDRRGIELSEIHQTLFTNYSGNHEFIKVNDAYFVVGSQLKSPMGSNAAAFTNKEAAEKKAAEIDGKVTNWATLFNVLK